MDFPMSYLCLILITIYRQQQITKLRETKRSFNIRMVHHHYHVCLHYRYQRVRILVNNVLIFHFVRTFCTKLLIWRADWLYENILMNQTVCYVQLDSKSKWLTFNRNIYVRLTVRNDGLLLVCQVWNFTNFAMIQFTSTMQVSSPCRKCCRQQNF